MLVAGHQAHPVKVLTAEMSDRSGPGLRSSTRTRTHSPAAYGARFEVSILTSGMGNAARVFDSYPLYNQRHLICQLLASCTLSGQAMDCMQAMIDQEEGPQTCSLAVPWSGFFWLWCRANWHASPCCCCQLEVRPCNGMLPILTTRTLPFPAF